MPVSKKVIVVTEADLRVGYPIVFVDEALWAAKGERASGPLGQGVTVPHRIESSMSTPDPIRISRVQDGLSTGRVARWD